MKHEFKIIPKEEVLANRSNAYEFIDFDKQETLEEVAEKYVNGRCTGGIMERALLSAIEFGAKWQQEQDKKMYSEEELRNAMNWMLTQYFEFYEWPATGRVNHYIQTIKQQAQ